jgi:hypothetical protein
MPLYDFEDTNTGERFTKLMSISSREEYLETNPHIKSLILSAPPLVSGHNLQAKQDSGWNDNLKRIADSHQGSALADKVGGRSTKQAKVTEIQKKHQKRVKDSEATKPT